MSKYEIVWEFSMLLFLGIGIIWSVGFIFGEQWSFFGVLIYPVYLYLLPKTNPPMEFTKIDET